MAGIYLRGKTWWVTYRLNGEAVWESLKTRDEKKAQRAQAVIEDKLARGELERDRKVPLDVFLVDYETAYIAAGGRDLKASRETTWKKDSYALRHFVEFCTGRNVSRLDRVTPSLVEDYRRARTGEGVADSTANKDLRVLKCAWNWAKRMGHVKGENPFALVKLVQIPEHEVEALTPDEVRTLLELVKDRSMYPLVATALYAGLRLSELLSLEWDVNVDLEGGWIKVVNTENFKTKSRRTRKVPIAPELEAILHAHRAGWLALVEETRKKAKAGDVVARQRLSRVLGLQGDEIEAVIAANALPEGGRCFLTRAGEPMTQNVGQRLTELGKRKKIYVTPHVLRKTFGTILLARDVPIERISAWLGHSSIAVTQKWYARHTLEAGREHINALSFETKEQPRRAARLA